MNQLVPVESNAPAYRPKIGAVGTADDLCRLYSKRELAEFIVRRSLGNRKAAKARVLPIEDRLSANLLIRVPDLCYIWQGSTNGRGYGIISVEGRRCYVHRVTYELEHGPIPRGLMIDHLCRQTLCCNPDHLEAVTNRENTIRGKVSALRHLRKAA